MATAYAREATRVVGNPVSLGYWSPVFENNPSIAKPHEKALFIPGHRPGHRPYILGRHNDNLIWNPHHRPAKGDIFLTDRELEAQRRCPAEFMLVEPHVKGKVSADNKDWGWDNWVELVSHAPENGCVFVQLDYGKELLPGVQSVSVGDFREGVAVLKAATLFVGTDGGLHHAAAAVGTDAVVLWGGYSSPDILGYADQANLRADVETCGLLKSCAHCRDAMSRITVDRVRHIIQEIIGA